MRSFLLLALVVTGLRGQTAEIRGTIERAIPPIQKSAAAFVAKRACVSCHHNILPVLMFHAARERGIGFDAQVLASVETKTFRALSSATAFDDAVQAVGLNDPTPNDSFLLMAANAAGIQPNLTTSVYARRLAGWQRPDGHWITSDFRPPHSSSCFTATATAVRAITIYGNEQDRRGIGLASQWLVHSRPSSTEDASFRLMGLAWASAAANEIAIARRDLIAMRKPSGGWSELPNYEPDGYSTGEALYALNIAGTPLSDPAIQEGMHFLVSSQAADGTWRVRTRMLSPAEVSPEYFDTGFPYRKDEFLSYAGSVWAVLALLRALPETASQSGPRQPLPIIEPREIALNGSPEQLAKLLDAGLDPSTKTDRGTSLLMIAAGNADKIRLLLSRGADPKARAASGVDALTIAAALRGSGPSVKLLLDAGAAADLPEGVHSKNTPLLLASMTGDVENVKLLLAHGAEPTSSALSEAVTFGYPDVVRILIDAGANPKLTESSGINLLHWAAVANRPAVIPILAAAGVAINAQDEHGFTPIMYAATIDFGNTTALQALLKAGGDPKIRNEDGRNAIEQAHHFGHVNLEAVLRNSKR